MGDVTVGMLEEGVRDTASACTKAIDLLKNHTPQPFKDLLEPATKLNDLLPNITKFKLGGTKIPGMPDIVTKTLETIDTAEKFISIVSAKLGCCIGQCWSVIDPMWGCVWGMFTSVVKLPDLSVLSEVADMIKKVLELLQPLIDAAEAAAKLALEGGAKLVEGVIDNIPGASAAKGLMKGLF